jgi:uncharacterized damage-inducible protein DinB
MTLSDAWKYHQWAIEKTLESCQDLTGEDYTRDLGNSFSSVRDTLVHCLMADNAWYHRIHKLEFTRPDPSNYPNLESLRLAWQPVLANWAELIAQTDLEQLIEYKAFDGAGYHNSFEEIARHVVNHGAYHRGQVAFMLRLLGKQAQATDWIAFSRFSRT